MNDEQRYVCENFRTAVNAVRTGSDGFPADPSQSTEWRILSGLAYGLITDVCAGEADEDERAWRRAAQATWDLIASARAGSRDPDTAARWFSARGALPMMEIRGEG